MIDAVSELAESFEEEVIGYRRDFHRYAESGWTEFRTASLVARRLTDLGYDVQLGRQVVGDEERMGLPTPDALEQHRQRALEQGADAEFLEALKGGFTGVVGILRNGRGPTVGLRFDMDAVDVSESESIEHRPVQEGFASVNSGLFSLGHRLTPEEGPTRARTRSWPRRRPSSIYMPFPGIRRERPASTWGGWLQEQGGT